MIATHSRALPEVWQKFKELARENGRSANNAFNLLIEDAVAKWKLPKAVNKSK